MLQLVKFDVGTCDIYADCATCVTAAKTDPLNCGWCDGHCSTEVDCASGEWLPNSCPPLLYSVSKLLYFSISQFTIYVQNVVILRFSSYVQTITYL